MVKDSMMQAQKRKLRVMMILSGPYLIITVLVLHFERNSSKK